MTSDEKLELIRQIPIHGQDIADEFERLQERTEAYESLLGDWLAIACEEDHARITAALEVK